ncbi:hypothetical protein MYRA21_0110 [Myroides sp. A21]|uniref:hypothetical protein n=1 Tax=Myroides sp. A21 TaxID=1583100 RepID=UPI00057DEFDC|nr:hypothetical protein [Myroides sp. A21]AJA67354.1 hypothetical protein MYRA21_0110 [Myroides sp. A21]
MRENSILKERILQYLDYKGIKKTNFYAETGVSNGVLSQNNGLSEDNLMRFLNFYTDINSNWLLTGEGEMLKSDTPLTSKEPAPKRNLIPLYEDVQSIGGTATVANTDSVYQTSEFIDAGDWFTGATAAIRHYGDSMTEYPSGCILALKEVIDRDLIIWGRNYCIETAEYRITKKLYDDGDTIAAISTNEETYGSSGRLIHPEITIPKKSVRKMFLVLGYVVKEYSNGPVFINN